MAGGGARPTGGAVGPRLAVAASFSLATCVAVVVTGWLTDTRLGAPLYWPWMLTGLQVLALWSAGSGRRWGWLLGAAVQPPWIAYAVVTDQLGFIPGCAVSAAVQTVSFLRQARRPRGRGGPARTRAAQLVAAGVSHPLVRPRSIGVGTSPAGRRPS